MRHISFPDISDRNKARMMVAGYLLFCALYLGAPHLAWRQPSEMPLLTPDRDIPFIPWSVWIYLSQFGLLFCAIWFSPDTETRTRAFYAMLLASAAAALVFVFFPTVLPRRQVSSPVWRLLYFLDVPCNCFPSLHAALAALSVLALRRAGKVFSVMAPLWAALIMFSTLTTKQHVVVDVAGGLALASVSHVMVVRWRREYNAVT